LSFFHYAFIPSKPPLVLFFAIPQCAILQMLIAEYPSYAILWRETCMKIYLIKFKEAVLQALAHDIVNTSKAAAYSGMLMFFPALLVFTTLISQVEEGPTMVGETRAILEQFLPADTLDLVQSAVLTHHLHSTQLILSASVLSLFAGLGAMLSLMEGFRRAYQLPPEDWSFWGRRGRALLLVPIALLPFTLASLVIVFGHQIELWIIDNAGHELRHVVIFFWRMVRWSVTFLTVTTVFTALYHFGTRRREHWLWVVPGAVAGSVIWFPTTLAYGFYVTRVADYTRIYGSFAAGIATLVWLYISSFSVLLGAELNGVLYWERMNHITQEKPVSEPAPLSN
jgi:membrane protein